MQITDIRGQTGGRATGNLGGRTSVLDADGDGNPLDDILRMAGKKAP